MTSLPLHWPLAADFADLAKGEAPPPWQRRVIEQCYTLVPLDTLSPDETGDAPLSGRDRLAVIQPRGLSPADNVALDQWVRAGGQLLLVLDPMLTGEYDLPLGDPRRPADIALIPPVVERWGLRIGFRVHEVWEDGIRNVSLGANDLTVVQGGDIEIIRPDAAKCIVQANAVIAQCEVGDGRVTLVADAAVFEDAELAGEKGAVILTILDMAFD